MKRNPIKSRTLASVGYENGMLDIEFDSGRVWRYYDVPVALYTGLLQADSASMYFRSYINSNGYCHELIEKNVAKNAERELRETKKVAAKRRKVKRKRISAAIRKQGGDVKKVERKLKIPVEKAKIRTKPSKNRKCSTSTKKANNTKSVNGIGLTYHTRRVTVDEARQLKQEDEAAKQWKQQQEEVEKRKKGKHVPGEFSNEILWPNYWQQ